jgi:alkylhydroperoxidase family enzyme
VARAIQAGRWREASLDERGRALCEIAEKLSANPVSVTAADWEPVRAVGLDDEGCLEVGHVVGVFNHLTRLADGFGIELDEPTRLAADGGAPLQRPGAG